MRFDQTLKHIRKIVEESDPRGYQETARGLAICDLADLLTDYDRVNEVYRKMVSELNAYSQELGVALSISLLISSHRHLRKENMKSQEQMNAELQLARESAFTTAHDATWIKLENLRNMTMGEITQLLENK